MIGSHRTSQPGASSSTPSRDQPTSAEDPPPSIVSWDNLPKDVIGVILDHLATPDAFRMRCPVLHELTIPQSVHECIAEHSYKFCPSHMFFDQWSKRFVVAKISGSFELSVNFFDSHGAKLGSVGVSHVPIHNGYQPISAKIHSCETLLVKWDSAYIYLPNWRANPIDLKRVDNLPTRTYLSSFACGSLDDDPSYYHSTTYIYRDYILCDYYALLPNKTEDELSVAQTAILFIGNVETATTQRVVSKIKSFADFCFAGGCYNQFVVLSRFSKLQQPRRIVYKYLNVETALLIDVPDVYPPVEDVLSSVTRDGYHFVSLRAARAESETIVCDMRTGKVVQRWRDMSHPFAENNWLLSPRDNRVYYYAET